MYRLTTPQHTFTLPFDTSLVKNLIVSYGQGEGEVLTKELEDCTLEGKLVKVRLSQEDTKKFTPDVPVKIQIRLLTVAGEALASREYIVRCEDVLNDEVLT